MTQPAARRGVLASLSLAMLLSSLGTSIANVALPTLADAFGASFQAAQWVVLAYLLASTSSIVGVGRLGDAIGRRRVLAAGIALFTAASASAGLAPTLGALIAARAVQGLGAAAMLALTLALVGEAVPKERSGRAMGLLGSMSAIGTALGPSLGGLLIAAFGWRAIFLVKLPLGLVALMLVRGSLPPDRRSAPPARAAFDAAGTLWLSLSLAAYALATTTGRGSFGRVNLALLAAAALGAGLFLRVETRATEPLVRLAMLRDGGLRTGLALSAIVATVLMATLVVGPFYLSRALGLDAAWVGLLMSVGPATAALTGAPAGRLVDRFGAARLALAGLAGIGIGCLSLAGSPPSLGLVGYAVPMVVMTAGYALFQTANNTSVLADVAQDRRGLVSGLLNLSRNLGLITGTAVMGAVFALGSGVHDVAAAPPSAVAAGLRLTFAVATALVALAAAIALPGRAFAGRQWRTPTGLTRSPQRPSQPRPLSRTLRA